MKEGDILLELLARFPRYLDNRWVRLDGARAYFGDGGNGENGTRTNSSVAFTAALLATNAKEFGLTPETADLLRERCAAVLRYLVGSHRTGDNRCANGGKWGLEWQSAWWATKLALAARLIWPSLDAADRAGIERVVVGEADRQLSRIVPTGLFQDTKAEENAWDAEILAAALALLPGHANASRWREKFIEFSANVFSTPQDLASAGTLDGRQIKDLIYTCNLHSDCSLENHGTYHFCYVASPLVSKAWCFYALAAADVDCPEALNHNVGNVWALAEKTFLANRFAYIGGQDWARYTYGEYFIVPALTFLEKAGFAPRVADIRQARLATLLQESRGNDDGSFYGSRFTAGHYAGQHAKYETDCFCCMALAWALGRTQTKAPPAVRGSTPADALAQHVSPEGQFCFQRTTEAFFSFAWSTLEETTPNVILVPLADDSLAEWHAGNMIGTVNTLHHGVTVGVRAMRADAGGISIEGTCLTRTRRGRPLFEHSLAIRFDAASSAVTIHSRFVSRSRLWFATVTGLNMRYPNDIFNGGWRTIASPAGADKIAGSASKNTAERPAGTLRRLTTRILRKLGYDGSRTRELRSHWINIDDRIGVVVRGAAPITLRQFKGRESTWRSLAVDQVEAPVRRRHLHIAPNTEIIDSRTIVHIGDRSKTISIAGTPS